MAAAIRIEQFNGKSNVAEFLERLGQAFIANDIPDQPENADKRKAILLSALSSEVYSTVRDICSPTIPSSKTYVQLADILKARFEEKRLVIAESFRFYDAHQRGDENITEFACRLQKLASSCDFGAFLQRALRDRFVSGIRSRTIQSRLLAKENTFEQALAQAQAFELAEKDLAQLQSGIHENAMQVRSKFKSSIVDCFRCGQNHDPNQCWFKDKECFSCKKIGHAKKMCKSKKGGASDQKKQKGKFKTDKKKKENADFVEDSESKVSNEKTTDTDSMYHINIENSKGPYTVDLVLGGNKVNFVVDTGASVTVIHETVYKEHFQKYPLQKSKVTLNSYSGDRIPVVGEIEIPVSYHNQCFTLPLLVANGERVSLLGRNWLKYIKLNWCDIFNVKSTTQSIDEIMQKYSSSSTGQGMKNFQAEIKVQPDSQPIFHKARPVPYALRPLVEKELDRLEGTGIIKKVEHSSWATPLVVVPKANGQKVRLCGDYKVTVNRVIVPDPYPLPTAEDLFATLAGGKYFSVIDLENAYLQVPLSEESKQFLTINTSRGLFQYQTLSFGVSTAGAIFQRIMDQLLCGIEGVTCYLDDILIQTKTKEEHLKTVDLVMSLLSKNGIKVNIEKCSFLQESVKYLGHKIDADGIHPTVEKVEAILKAPNPSCVKELRAMLGLIQYYHKFLPQLSTLLAPLHHLLKSGVTWKWSKECSQAWSKCKELLTQNTVLVHYDPNKPIVVAADASPVGVGCVISHIMPNGEERPVAFASRTLTSSEKNYSQIEREGLAIVFAMAKFNKMLYGRRFILYTDHRPLTTIFGPKKGVPAVTAMRLQRWALLLMTYTYDIRYKRSEDNSNADALSRLPLHGSKLATENEVNYFSNCDLLPVLSKDIAAETKKDPILSRVLQYVLSGWPAKVAPELKDFACKKHELSADQGCLLWGMRVIIPPKFRSQLLGELHKDHPGMRRMKELARNYLWYPGMDQDVENLVSKCEGCQLVRNDPVKGPTIPWRYPERPMERVHIDYAEFEKQNYLVIVDAFSKWIDVVQVSSTSTSSTISVLRKFFSQFGLPEELVSDNAAQFTCKEFEHFLQMNGVKHTKSPPYHPASNGAAERQVQNFKHALKKQLLGEGKPDLDSFLLTYRSTPHRVTGVSPAELFLKRQVRTRLSLLKPNLKASVENKQWKEAAQKKSKTGIRQFSAGDKVLVRNKVGKDKWVQGVIVKVVGVLKYLVRVQGRTRYCHMNHLRASQLQSSMNDDVTIELDDIGTSDNNSPIQSSQIGRSSDENVGQDKIITESVSMGTPVRRYPLRQRKPKKILDM